jgi:uncharacterized protein
MHKQNYELLTYDNEILRITTFGEVKNINRCIIYVHGFKGFKDWGFVPYLSEFLASKGFFVLTFNFSHNGIGSNPLEFTEMDKFAKNTYSREVRELSELISAYSNGFFGKVSSPKIGLLGHSRGGAISILNANMKKDIASVCLWASISKIDRYSEHQKLEWRKKKYLDAVNQRTGQIMKLDISVLNDIEQNLYTTLNIEKSLNELKKPVLIIHGEEDLTVPIKEAEDIFRWSGKKSTQLVRMPSVGHTFNIVHPFEGSNKKFDEILDRTYLFFKDNLIRSFNGY